MKFLVVLVVALLSAPQAVRGFQSPILALVIIVTPFLFFAIFVVALEFRDRQVSDLYRENENLKKAIRPLARENPNLKTQIQQLRRENANLKAEVQQFSNPINPSDKSSKLHDFEHLKAPIRQL
jgi:cell division protein FtsB